MVRSYQRLAVQRHIFSIQHIWLMQFLHMILGSCLVLSSVVKNISALVFNCLPELCVRLKKDVTG